MMIQLSNFKILCLVTLGVILTIASAVITNSFLEKNNLKISALNKDSAVIERQINDSWQLVQESERKLDLAINTISQKSNKSNKDNKVISQYFYDWFSKIESSEGVEISTNSNIIDYIKLVSDFKGKTINDINDLYLKKISLEDRKSEIIEYNMLLKNLALLFQILGLILVLSKSF